MARPLRRRKGVFVRWGWRYMNRLLKNAICPALRGIPLILALVDEEGQLLGGGTRDCGS
jgi:hypothetical protein